MAISVTMPQMGESVVEGTIERWLVREGEQVEKDQTLCEITTDKVDAEIPAPERGVVTQITAAEGVTVEVGGELAVIDPEAAPTVATSEPAAEPMAVAAPGRSDRPSSQAADPEAGRRASPLARRIAESEGLKLDGLSGSGPAGRVTKADVLARIGDAPSKPAPAATAAQAPAPGTIGEFLSRMRLPRYRPREGERVVPFTSIRRRIAEHMVVSKLVSPHVGTVAEVDLQRLVRLREGAKAGFKRDQGFSLTYLPFVIQATVRALKEFPRLNASVVDESIIERDGFHIGVAVETERGLVVPVVRNADHLSLTGLAQAIEEIAQRARARELSADDLHGGTFTVTNPGRRGNLYGFAVINQPQVGILRMGEVKKRPIVIERDREDTIVIHPMMYLALSYDHRIIDGVTGNGFLYSVAEYLEAAEFEI